MEPPSNFDYKEVFFMSEPGQRVWRELQDEFYHRMSFVHGNSPEDTAFYEGQRAVVIFIAQKLEGDANLRIELSPDNAYTISQQEVMRRPEFNVFNLPEDDMNDVSL